MIFIGAALSVRLREGVYLEREAGTTSVGDAVGVHWKRVCNAPSNVRVSDDTSYRVAGHGYVPSDPFSSARRGQPLPLRFFAMAPFERYVAAHRARRIADAAEAAARSLAAMREAKRTASTLGAGFSINRVVLYGSLARGGFTARSDVDLAVEGLPVGALVAAEVLANADTRFDISIIRIEDAPLHIRRAVDEEGIELWRR